MCEDGISFQLATKGGVEQGSDDCFRPESDAPRTPQQESTVLGVQSPLKRVPSKVAADSLRVCKHVFFGFLVDDITKRLEERGGICVFFAIGKIEFVVEVRWVLALIVLEHCFQFV